MGLTEKDAEMLSEKHHQKKRCARWMQLFERRHLSGRFLNEMNKARCPNVITKASAKEKCIIWKKTLHKKIFFSCKKQMKEMRLTRELVEMFSQNLQKKCKMEANLLERRQSIKRSFPLGQGTHRMPRIQRKEQAHRTQLSSSRIIVCTNHTHIETYLLGLLAMIKCSICSYQCDIWYASNWKLACHINFSWGGVLLSLLKRPSSVALAWHKAGSSTPFGVTNLHETLQHHFEKCSLALF